jgi:hypothetical protein
MDGFKARPSECIPVGLMRLHDNRLEVISQKPDRQFDLDNGPRTSSRVLPLLCKARTANSCLKLWRFRAGLMVARYGY